MLYYFLSDEGRVMKSLSGGCVVRLFCEFAKPVLPENKHGLLTGA